MLGINNHMAENKNIIICKYGLTTAASVRRVSLKMLHAAYISTNSVIDSIPLLPQTEGHTCVTN